MRNSRVGIVGIMAAALAAMGAGAAGASERMTDGLLTYLARIALPPEAVAVVEIRGPDGALAAEARIPTAGRQVPIPFALARPEGEGMSLGAAIFDGGRPLWLGGPVPLGADGEGPGEIMLSPLPAAGYLHVLRCGAEEITLSLAAEAAAMTARGKRAVLEQVPAASGARYEAPGDPGTYLWLKGMEALASLGGAELGPCAMGVPRAEPPLRARGNEPGWNLEIAQGRLTLVTAYGAERREAALPIPVINAAETVYRLTGPDATIRVSTALCRDDATGMPHPRTVSVEMGETLLRGCGGAPVDLLAGGEWVVADIAGRGVIDSARATLDFAPGEAAGPGPMAEGRVSGSGGCNRYSAGFRLTGEGLSVGPAASTMMACAESVMNQERAFLDALAGIAAFDIDETGALILKAADGRRLLLARRG
ncbi:META domain-containing protein [Limibaculum sp. FT325]|uniref:META domain-containing protein n=1 Tax=Thermohalobaculum sediminis TaxID=2939436 RepID=UPI0020C04FF2|nr:META domain-containing protein [Limibaculum sediminis]MCL5778309.1 META domain-containing protein [Limibaculum sediminis]